MARTSIAMDGIPGKSTALRREHKDVAPPMPVSHAVHQLTLRVHGMLNVSVAHEFGSAAPQRLRRTKLVLFHAMRFTANSFIGAGANVPQR